MKHSFLEICDAVMTGAAGLIPGALGAAVSLAYEKGISWAERFTQLAVGIVISFFVSRAAGAVWGFDPFVVDGIGFTFGMIAFKATPRFIANAVDVVAGIPAILRDLAKPGGVIATIVEAVVKLFTAFRDRRKGDAE